MAKFLRIALWNANGLAQRKDEIHPFLQHNKIDILLISETHFTMKTHLKYHTKIHIYYTNHPDGSAHAGTAVLEKHKTRHHELPKFEEDFLQATSIRVSALPFDLTAFLYSTYTSSQYINIIGINQKLMCTISFQTIFYYLNPPNGIL
jgi:exonuclease III